MYSFLAERAASGDYTGQLGLVSVIRKDLEHLVKALHEHHRQLDRHAKPTEPGQADPPGLFNVYRMLRATRDLSPASTFLGGEYQAVAMLLAMLTQDPHVFAQAVDAPAGPGAGVAGGLAWTEPQYQNWADFVTALTPERRTSDHGAGPVHVWRNRVTGEIPAADLAAWSRMARAAEETSSLVRLPDLTAFRAWVPHVRRFSYLPLTPAKHRPDPVGWPDGPPSGGREPGEAAEVVLDDGS